MTKKFLGLTILAVAFFPIAALADSPAWEFTTVGTSYNNGDGYSLGEVFVPTQNMNVDFLGYYTNGGGASGLTEDHSVYGQGVSKSGQLVGFAAERDHWNVALDHRASLRGIHPKRCDPRCVA